MTTTMTATARTDAPARNAAVRIGRRTHAGHLAARQTADGPMYAASCGAGRGWHGPGGTESVTTRPATHDRIDCGNCVRRFADLIARIHDAQDRAAGRAVMADTATEPHTDAGQPERPAAAVDPADIPDSRTRAAWRTIRQSANANGSDPARRRRAAWIVEAWRHVYALPMTATPGEVQAAAHADDRDETTLARLYLTAYAGQLDDRAQAVDRAAYAYATTDEEQTAAGVRPADGTLVTVDGHPGAWTVIRRSPREQRRYPYAVRVRQVAHTFNGSVPLGSVSPIVQAPVADPAGWQAVTVGGEHITRGTHRDDAYEARVYDAATGAYAGRVWRDRAGQWFAHRRLGPWTSGANVSQAEAFAAVNWLCTAPVAFLVDRAAAGLSTAVILSDGTAAVVESADTGTAPTDRARRCPAGLYTPTRYPAPAGRPAVEPVVTVRMCVMGGHVDMFAPIPSAPGTRHAGDVLHAGDVPLSTRVALAPPCEVCDSSPGEVCQPGCPSLATD